MTNPEIIRLVIAYTLLGVFIFTAGITCLSLVGVVKFANQKQQQTLFKVLVVEVATGSVGLFFNFVSLNAGSVANKIENRGAQNADLLLTSKTTEAVLQELRDANGAGTQAQPASSRVVPLTVKVSSAEGVLTRILLDGVSQTGSANGEREIETTPGIHFFSYFVVGPPNSPFAIEVRNAASTILQIDGHTESGQAAGVRRLDIK